MNTLIDCRELVGAIGDAIIAADAGGAIVLWNPGAARMFGHTEDEALGKSLDLITPERLRSRHWEGYDKSMASGTTKYGNDVLRVPALHKDGHTLSIAFTVSMIFTADHKVGSIVAIVRDETKRFAEERELRKRVMELEAELGAKP